MVYLVLQVEPLVILILKILHRQEVLLLVEDLQVVIMKVHYLTDVLQVVVAEVHQVVS